MGLLVDGQWQDRWYETAAHRGAFKRELSQFRHWVTEDGEPGPSGRGGFRAEPGRYHLYISHACPWAHRTAIYRRLKGLESVISESVVSWLMGSEGWVFESGPGGEPDPILGARCLWELYRHAQGDYTGRVTVPLLWDRKERTIVSNESSEIIRMFDGAFLGCGAEENTFYPGPLQAHIDQVNLWVYHAINNGVYRAGFATEQDPYEEAVRTLFDALDRLDEHLGRFPYLVGESPSEADWRLFTTLVRFDAVYVGHFKCNLRRIEDYPHLWIYTRRLFQMPGIAETFHLDHVKNHYYGSHANLNPSGVIPCGPDLDFNTPVHPVVQPVIPPTSENIEELFRS